MSEPKRPDWPGEADWKRAQSARKATTAAIGAELINAFNQGWTDPSDMAGHGHETSTGFEFHLERDGVTYTIAVSRDMGT
jgi:hypothetical protein